MAEYINPFDFRKILVQTFLGNTELFLFVFVITMSMTAGAFRMSNKIFITLLVICSLIFGFMLGQATYVLIVLVVGYISFKTLARILT